jgi:hypothetical protein
MGGGEVALDDSPMLAGMGVQWQGETQPLQFMYDTNVNEHCYFLLLNAQNHSTSETPVREDPTNSCTHYKGESCRVSTLP